MNERVAIIGGEGNMGKAILFQAKQQGHETMVVDPRAPNSPSPEEALAWASVVYFSVFPAQLAEIAVSQRQNFKPGQIVAENCSVKGGIIPILEALDEDGVSTISTHPLAKHDQPPQGVKVLVMDVGKNSPKAREFVTEFHRNSGMIVINHELSRHDEVMGPEQGFPHLINRTAASVVSELGLDTQELWNLAPANAELFWMANWRSWMQDPKVAASIVSNFVRTPIGLMMIEAFRDELDSIIETAKDEEALARSFQETFQRLNQNGMKEEMNKTTTIVLERIANLRMGSIVVIAANDEPGVLHRIIGIFLESGINLTAVDSHLVQGDGVQFMIGEDPNSSEAALLQAKGRLVKQGFGVEQIKRTQ